MPGRQLQARTLANAQTNLAETIENAVPDAQIRWRYKLVANGLAVVVPSSQLGRLTSLPGVETVYPSVRYRTQLDRSPQQIGAPALWSAGLANAGQGMKIAIIDEGIDQTHPFFSPAGYTMPAGYPKGQTAYTTAKVIVARAFPPARPTWKHASKPFDPEISSHGTHVAGIAAGNANTLAEGARISGVAPRAYLGNYKALTIPTDADVGLDGNSPELVAAIEAAVADGMDVINMSLGEPEIEPARDIVVKALEAAARAGVVPVVSAGNDFDQFGRGSVGSPAATPSAITVGAVTTTRGGPDDVIASVLVERADAALAPAQARGLRTRREHRLGRSPQLLGDALRDEHGRTARRRRGRAAAPAAPDLDARAGQVGARAHRRPRLLERPARRRRRRRSAAAAASSTCLAPTRRRSSRAPSHSPSGCSARTPSQTRSVQLTDSGLGGSGPWTVTRRGAEPAGGRDDRRTGRRDRARPARRHRADDAGDRRRGDRLRRAHARHRAAPDPVLVRHRDARARERQARRAAEAGQLQVLDEGRHDARDALPLPREPGRIRLQRLRSPAPSASSASRSPARRRTSASSSRAGRPASASSRGSSAPATSGA